MTYLATIIEVFLSSPTDVGEERDEILAMTDEWNRLRGKDSACYFSILTWENAVAPSLGERPQQVVNDQIGQTYDAYLGVLWTRIGTPTGVSDSGTVEEYEGALKRVRNGDPVRVSVLFKKAPIDPSLIDPSQLAKVHEFKTKVSAEGGFYREFSDESSLRSVLFLYFEQLSKEFGNLYSEISSIVPNNNLDHGPSAAGDEPEIGLIENGEEFQILTNSFTEKLSHIASEENRNTETLKDCTEKLSTIIQFGSDNAQDIKRIIHESAVSMGNLARYIDENIEDIESDMRRMAQLIDNDLKISLELDSSPEQASEKISQLLTLSATLTGAVENLNSLIINTESLPRMSVEISRSKKKLVSARSRLRDEMLSLNESIENSLEFFRRSKGI